ncbi:MAG: LytTR family DNA-binding domain-containing protein [Ferruginibacter sp.]
MLRAVLIDDENNALEVLQMQLQQFCKNVEVIECCNGGEKGIAAIKKLRPELVFLDIEMPHKNGFDVLKETAGFNYEVIFTTAYDQFAIKAFKHSAVDYLLKPIDILELQEAVEKAARKTGGAHLEEKLKILLQQLEPGTAKSNNRIALPVGDGMQFFDMNEISRCESESNYTHIYLTNGKKHTIAKTLKDVEEALGGHDFFRVHQSHLVNMNHISKYVRGDSGYVVMNDGTNIALSRSRKEAFLETFKKL